MTNILNSLGVDRDMLIVLLFAISIILFVLVIIILVATRKMFRRYDFFMRGKDAETLEDIVKETYDKTFALSDIQMEHRDRIKLLQTSVNAAYNKSAVVKYNAFEGMGGQTSFVLAVLDTSNSGFVLNAMHSQQSCSLYLKEIKNGEPESALSNEEQKALRKAMEK